MWLSALNIVTNTTLDTIFGSSDPFLDGCPIYSICMNMYILRLSRVVDMTLFNIMTGFFYSLERRLNDVGGVPELNFKSNVRIISTSISSCV